MGPFLNSILFAALSDWGGQSTAPWTTPGQLEAAASLSRLATKPGFVVSAGGNFLSEGLPAGLAQAEARFAATFEDVYTGPGLSGIDWYVTSGWTDWNGNVTQEVAFNGSVASGSRWIYPDLWHTFTMTVPSDGTTVQLVMLDTVTLTGEQNQFPGYANVPASWNLPLPSNGRRRLADFDVHQGPPISEEQWLWVEKTLANSSADWLIVVGAYRDVSPLLS